ncbi:hypothetical protein HRI_003780100 [Hibiscus trionum]|uniref:Uncharacterized protein n=1 Tax=Hibiscus trionum TaxID=183268 RepID=A0A9W7IW95_HIBTR|nr:hypothetical protein HRI_003780100 [Hibiscus trionum]
MEKSFAKLEAGLRGQLERAQQELRDTIIKSQQDMMNEISQLLQANLKGKGAAGNPSQDKGDPSFSPGFVTNTPKPSQGAATQGDGATSHQAGASTHVPSGLIFNAENVGDSVPDLDEIENLNKVKVEFSKQLEETRKDLEEKFRTKVKADFVFLISCL